MSLRPGPKPVSGEKMRQAPVNFTSDQVDWIESAAQIEQCSRAEIVRRCVAESMKDGDSIAEKEEA